MNLIDELGKRQSLATKKKIVDWVGTNPGRFKQLMNIFLGDNYRLTQWAAWPISDIVELHPALIKPYLKPTLNNLDRPELHDAVRRNVLRLLQFIDIPPGLRGLAYDKAFLLFSDATQPIAVRVFAMTVMANIAETEPDLRNEVIPIRNLPSVRITGLCSRATKLLKKLRKQ